MAKRRGHPPAGSELVTRWPSDKPNAAPYEIRRKLDTGELSCTCMAWIIYHKVRGPCKHINDYMASRMTTFVRERSTATEAVRAMQTVGESFNQLAQAAGQAANDITGLYDQVRVFASAPLGDTGAVRAALSVTPGTVRNPIAGSADSPHRLTTRLIRSQSFDSFEDGRREGHIRLSVRNDEPFIDIGHYVSIEGRSGLYRVDRSEVVAQRAGLMESHLTVRLVSPEGPRRTLDQPVSSDPRNATVTYEDLMSGHVPDSLTLSASEILALRRRFRQERATKRPATPATPAADPRPKRRKIDLD